MESKNKNFNFEDLELNELRKKCRNLIWNRKKAYRKYKYLKHEFIKIWSIIRKINILDNDVHNLVYALLKIFFIIKYSNGIKIFGIEDFEKMIKIERVPSDEMERLIKEAFEGK